MAKESSSSSLSLVNGYQFVEKEELVVGGKSGRKALTWCDHLDGLSSDLSHIPNPNTPCSRCRNPDNNWLCLCCKKVLCSRNVNMHMSEHYERTDHCLKLSYKTLSVRCVLCNQYLDAQVNLKLRPLYETAYKLKYGQPPPLIIIGEGTIRRAMPQTKPKASSLAPSSPTAFCTPPSKLSPGSAGASSFSPTTVTLEYLAQQVALLLRQQSKLFDEVSSLRRDLFAYQAHEGMNFQGDDSKIDE